MIIFSLVWGLFEATFFPFAPDVILTFATLISLKSGLICTVFVLLGALLGGGIMHSLGRTNPALAIKIASLFPPVSQNMIYYVQDSLQKKGLIAIFIGSMLGVPYKVYAAESARALQISLSTFLLVSVPARLVRFLLGVLFLHFLVTFPLKNVLHLEVVLAIFWVTLYTCYFTRMNKWKKATT